VRLTRLQLRIAIAVVALLALVGLSFAARAGAPTTLANSADLAAQRTSAERTIDKVYKFGLQQLETTRGLRLAITDAQAAAIAEAYALTPDQASSYVGQAEQRLDSTAPAPSGEPTMLAPRLYQIVQRMADLGGQLTEAGIREMTQAPSGSPSPTARPSASPSPSPSASR
jgi:hypothetical protein